MAAVRRRRQFLWRLLHKGPQLAYSLGFGPVLGRRVLLLTSTGRRSGLPRITPLQYEIVGGAYLIGSARGMQADWVRNVQANPSVIVRIGDNQFAGNAMVSNNLQEIADFIQLRLERHPRMIGLLVKLEGLPARPTRCDVEAYASTIALVVVKPL